MKRKIRCNCGIFMQKKRVVKLKSDEDKYAISFKCPKCETEFKRDYIGIMISRDPSNDWKKRNMEVWESIKEINYPPKYLEIFTLE